MYSCLQVNSIAYYGNLNFYKNNSVDWSKSVLGFLIQNLVNILRFTN